MAGTYLKLADNAETTLNGSITDVATSIVVISVASLPSTFPYILTIWDEDTHPDPTDDSNMELVLVEGASGTTLTPVTRGYGTTSGVAHTSGDRISLLITKEIFTDATYGIETIIDDHLDNTLNPHTVTATQLTGAAIKVEYEGEANTNAYTDAEVAKVGFISVTQAVDLDAIESDVTINNAKITNATHTGDVTGSGALTISSDAVTNSKLANVATSTIKGRATAATGDPEDLTPSQVRTLINVEDGSTADQTGSEIKTLYESEADTNAFTDAEQTKVGFISVTQAVDLDTLESDVATNNAKITNATHTGDVTGSGALTIADEAVTNAKLAHIATSTIKGRITAATGDVEDLSAANVRTIINVEDGSTADQTASEVPIVDAGAIITATDVEGALQEHRTAIDLNTAKVTNATHTGDVTGSDALTIASDAVTYDKMQDTSDTDKLLGRFTAGAGTIEEIPCTAAGRALIDDADATAQRATLNVDVAGTDNSTDVTLAGTPDYITISGQIITRNQVDLATDVTGTLPEANGGTNQSTYAQGDLLYASAANTLSKLPKGTASQVLTMNVGATLPEWANSAAGFSDPMTTRGDIIIRNASNVTDRLAIGTNGQVLTSDGTDISWTASAGGAALVNIFLPAEAAYLPVTNPAALVEVLGATVFAGHSHLAYDDATAESAVWRVPVPDYDGGNIVVTAYSKVATTPGGAVTLQYDILTIGLANSEAFDSAITVDTTINISHSLNTSELETDIMVASATIDPANVAADDLLVIELKRDVASDDLVGDGELVGIMLEYTRV